MPLLYIWIVRSFYNFSVYPCELHCYTKEGKTPFADRLRDKVVDGTKCFPNSDDICVDGICRVSKRLHNRLLQN